MTWIYDERTPYSRLMVGYDRYGLTIRQWDENCNEMGYNFQEGVFTWDQYRQRDRSYWRDNGKGKLKERLVNGAISLLAYWGGSSDNSGTVDALWRYVNGSHVLEC